MNLPKSSTAYSVGRKTTTLSPAHSNYALNVTKLDTKLINVLSKISLNAINAKLQVIKSRDV